MAHALQRRSRRQGLLWAIRAAVGVTVAAVFYPVARYLQPRPVVGSGAMEMIAPYRVNELRAIEEKGSGRRRSTSAASPAW